MEKQFDFSLEPGLKKYKEPEYIKKEPVIITSTQEKNGA